jgi:hypothetical protein
MPSETGSGTADKPENAEESAGRLNPKTAIARGDLPQSAGREGPLSALTVTQRIRLALPQALSASILHHLIPSYRRFRVETILQACPLQHRFRQTRDRACSQGTHLRGEELNRLSNFTAWPGHDAKFHNFITRKP